MPLSNTQLRKLDPDDLVILVIEEASELIQAACKVRRFGFEGGHPERKDGQDTRNIDELCQEAEQACATARILGAKFGINYARTCDLRQVAAEKMWGSEARPDAAGKPQ